MRELSSQSEKPGGSSRSGRIQSVERAIRLLMLVASDTTPATTKELAGVTGLSVPTTHHLLSTLVSEGVLARDSKARYSLGLKVAVLADALQRAAAIPEYLHQPLRHLAAATGETAYVASWRQGDIRVGASVEGSLPVRVSLPLGPYVDAHARATGKVLLAFASDDLRIAYLNAHPLRSLTPSTVTDLTQLQEQLALIRDQGYAIDRDEFQDGVSCAAAPIIDDNTIIAAYSISVPSRRFDEREPILIDAVIRAAQLPVHWPLQPGDTRSTGKSKKGNRLDV